MASTRELWILLRARDEASRVVHSFSKNVRAAALSAQAAQKSAEAQAIRQQAQLLKTNGAVAQNIRAVNGQVIALEKQARAQTAAAAKAREYRAQQMKSIDAQVRSNNVHAAGLEKQARAFTLAASMADEHRTALVRLNGATNEATARIDNQIASLRKRASTLNAEAAIARGNSASLIAQLQQEQTGLDGSIRSHERRAAVIRSQAAQLRNVSSELKTTLDNDVRALTNQAAALDRQANSFRQAANAARDHDIAIRKTIDSLGKVSEAATVAAFAFGAIGVGGLIGLKSAIDTTIEYERQVRHTATQVDGFSGKLEELSAIGKRVANDIGVGFETIQPALFDIFSSMDVSMADAEKLLRSFSKAAVAGQVDIQDASRATIGLLNAFHRPAKDVNKILDIQFQLIQEGIGTYEEWNQRIGLVTPSAVRAGQSIEMMMAALATATRMGLSAARAGTSVARAMDAMSHPTAVKNLKALGVAVQDAKGKFRPMNEVLRDFREVLMKMPEKDRVKAILEVFKGAGGTIEARRFIQNILLGKNNLELFDNVLQETTKSAGSLEKAYGIMADSTAVKSELLRNKWQLLKTAIGEALLPGFNTLLDKLSALLDWFNKLPKSTQHTISQFILWGSVLAIVVAAIFGFIGVAAVFIAAIASIGATAAIALGVIATIPFVVAGAAAAFIYLYNKSEALRDVIGSVKDAFSEFWKIVTDTAIGIKEAYDQHLKPALTELWKTIEKEVLPRVQEFVDMVKDTLLPKLREAGDYIKDEFAKAFEDTARIIKEDLIPQIKELGEWWDQNKEDLKPVIETLGLLLVIVLKVIGFLGANGLVSSLKGLSFALTSVTATLVGLVAVMKLFNYIVDSQIAWVKMLITWLIKLISNGIDRARKAFKDFTDGIGNWRSVVNGAINAVRTAIANAFANAIKMLSPAGSNIVQGLINGMRGRLGDVGAIGRAVGNAAVEAAKAAAGVKSPSTKFRDIGFHLIQGLINGINGSRQALKNAMARLTHEVMASLKAGKASKSLQKSWQKRLSTTNAKLLALESRRAVINTKIANAQKSLNEQVKARADLLDKIKDKLSAGADLLNLEGSTPQELKKNLVDRLHALEQFRNNLQMLANKGLNKETIAQLAEAGVESAGTLVNTLAGASQADIQEINRLQQDIRNLAKGTATDVAGSMYDAGIAAAQGLINGLQRQSAAITKEMEKIAQALIKAIKKQLGIKSPSKVFENIGRNTALGYIIGFRKQMLNEDIFGTGVIRSNVIAGTGATSTVPNRSFNQSITVYTQEIDPRRHAAELGWELEGRMD